MKHQGLLKMTGGGAAQSAYVDKLKTALDIIQEATRDRELPQQLKKQGPQSHPATAAHSRTLRTQRRAQPGLSRRPEAVVLIERDTA